MQRRSRRSRKRDIVVEMLGRKFELVTPGGAFYAFPRRPRGAVATTFVTKAIEHNVLIIPATSSPSATRTSGSATPQPTKSISGMPNPLLARITSSLTIIGTEWVSSPSTRCSAGRVGVLALGMIKGHQRLSLLARPGFPLPQPPPRATVLVPVKDEARQIASCIESILQLDYPNSQVIVDRRPQHRWHVCGD
jgi:hypothetical protein